MYQPPLNPLPQKDFGGVRKEPKTLWTVFCDSLSSVVAGTDDRLYDGWVHSYPAGHRHRSGADPSYSRTKTIVTIRTLDREGEGFTERSNCYEKEE